MTNMVLCGLKRWFNEPEATLRAALCTDEEGDGS
jgi:hypothetical protein